MSPPPPPPVVRIFSTKEALVRHLRERLGETAVGLDPRHWYDDEELAIDLVAALLEGARHVAAVRAKS